MNKILSKALKRALKYSALTSQLSPFLQLMSVTEQLSKLTERNAIGKTKKAKKPEKDTSRKKKPKDAVSKSSTARKTKAKDHKAHKEQKQTTKSGQKSSGKSASKRSSKSK